MNSKPWLAVLLVLGLAACASHPPRPPSTDPLAQCVYYLRVVDDTVARYGVGDAGAWRLPGYPHLRSNRFLAAFREAPLDEQQTRAWLLRLQAQDLAARTSELARLAPGVRAELGQIAPGGREHAAAIADCAALLIERDLQQPENLASIRIRSRVPDHYSDWQRIAGLYPVSQLVARRAISGLHERLAAEFAQPLAALPVRGHLQRYVPARPSVLDVAQVRSIIRRASANPLRVPEPDREQQRQLLNHYAPIWELEELTEDDRIGRIRFRADRRTHEVDTTAPAVYQWTSHTLFDEQPLLQLNYLVWVTARTAESATDIYAGKFDGLIWRVTLLPDGSPLAFDSIHPCGCYYLLFPGPRAAPRATSNISEPVLIAQHLPALTSGQRFVIRVRAGDHYIQKVYPDSATAGRVYAVEDYDALLAMDDGNGHAHGLFDEEGLLRDSARPERYLLWPFGIASAGAMRQNGTQAIAFVGVRHFDDAHLLQELVRLVE